VETIAQLLADLVAIDSVNPDLVPGGAGEGIIAPVAPSLEGDGSELSIGEPNGSPMDERSTDTTGVLGSLDNVNWPQVRDYVKNKDIDKLHTWCGVFWKIDLEEVLGEARKRWPDLFYEHKLIPLRDGSTLYELVLTDEWQDVPDDWGVPSAEIRMSPFTGIRQARKLQAEESLA